MLTMLRTFFGNKDFVLGTSLFPTSTDISLHCRLVPNKRFSMSHSVKGVENGPEGQIEETL